MIHWVYHGRFVSFVHVHLYPYMSVCSCSSGTSAAARKTTSWDALVSMIRRQAESMRLDRRSPVSEPGWRLSEDALQRGSAQRLSILGNWASSSFPSTSIIDISGLNRPGGVLAAAHAAGMLAIGKGLWGNVTVTVASKLSIIWTA